FKNAGDVFGTKDPSFGQKISSGLGSLINGLSFGLIDGDKTTRSLYGLGGGKANKKKSFADGGVIDYTSKADVHGYRDNPEMVLNSNQTTGLFHFIKELSDSRIQEKKEFEREKNRGDKSSDPTIRTATWMERMAK